MPATPRACHGLVFGVVLISAFHVMAADLAPESLRLAATQALPSKPERWTGEVFAQDIWTKHTVLHMSHQGRPHVFPFVAVDTDHHATVLTETRFRTRFRSNPRPEPIEGFNQVAKAEALELDDANIRAYAELFLRVHPSSAGLYIPTRKQTAALLYSSAPTHSSARKAERAPYKYDPVFHVTSTKSGYRVVAYSWRFWFDGFYEHVACIARDGSVSYSSNPLGTPEHPRIEPDGTSETVAIACE